MTTEFELIRRHAPPGARRLDVLLGSGDDAAILKVPPGKALVATVDTLVAGRHFPIQTAAYDIGWKALAVNLSDLAAMGAEAAWVTVALTMPVMAPGDQDQWMEDLTDGIQTLAERSGVAVVGGDLTAGPLSITIQALGLIESDCALRRDTAQAGDLIAVTGHLGDAALALRLMQAGSEVPPVLLERLNRPEPRLSEGSALVGKAHAAIDISDGLLADLGHMLEASSVGATIDCRKLPLSETFRQLCPIEEQATLALTGGDDYELCLCIAPDDFARLDNSLKSGLKVVGVITGSTGLEVLGSDGHCMDLPVTGYDHFRFHSGPDS